MLTKSAAKKPVPMVRFWSINVKWYQKNIGDVCIYFFEYMSKMKV